jgi:lysophospholipase L1-like esterase
VHQAFAPTCETHPGSFRPQTVTAVLTFFDRVLSHTDKFCSNLNTILDLFAKYSPSTSLVLITPPPISAKDRAAQIAPRPLDRDPAVTREYAEAVLAVGDKRGVPAVDLWNGVVSAVEGGEPNVGSVMRDGLHLNKAGYQVSRSHRGWVCTLVEAARSH